MNYLLKNTSSDSNLQVGPTTDDYSTNFSDLQLGDVINKYLSFDEQLVAEALGALFYKRSLKIFDVRNSKDRYQLTVEQRNDGSKYGAEYYKYLGYRLLIQTKKMTHQVNHGRTDDEIFTWQDMLVIQYGEECRAIIKNPIANNFSF